VDGFNYTRNQLCADIDCWKNDDVAGGRMVVARCNCSATVQCVQWNHENWCYHEKFRNFVAWAEPDPKTAFFAFLRYPLTILHTAYRKQFYPKQMVLMESRDSEGVPFESVTRHLADIGP